MRIYTKSLFILLITINQAYSQELDEIMVTGSLLTDDYYGMPAITIKKKADFLLQKVRFINDSRSPDLRKNEILRSIITFLKSAEETDGIDLSYGSSFLQPLDLTDNTLELNRDRTKADTNYVDIIVKSTVDDSKPIKAQIASLQSFIEIQQLTGRTEIENQDDINISIVNPEQYRYEILGMIAKENKVISDVVGNSCSITLSGLEGRVTWERTNIDELTLYIPYGTGVTCKY